MKIKTTRDLKIRLGEANTSAPWKGTIRKGFEINVVDSVKGQEISGNDLWYFDDFQNYYWSGGAELVDEAEEVAETEELIPPNSEVLAGNGVLRLGISDKGARPVVPANYLSAFHEGKVLSNKSKFKGEGLQTWYPIVEASGKEVLELQILLRQFGFYPFGQLDGIYGYRTCSAVRLFQEYIRSEKGDAAIGIPDGKVGPKTRSYLKQWHKDQSTSLWSAGIQTDEFMTWLNLIRKFKEDAIKTPNAFYKKLGTYSSKIDSLTPEAWNTSSNEIHIVGIRCQNSTASDTVSNNDYFVLLVNGVAYKFYGSTDPNVKYSAANEPFLLAGQHQYRLGWHNLSSAKVYRALRPYKRGVIVRRDYNQNNKLDVNDRIDPQPNTTINIHWGGMGYSVWSAGCQVIIGEKYKSPNGKVIDCGNIGSTNYQGLGVNGKAKGAYTVFNDLLTVFSETIEIRNQDKIYYTLMEEEYVKHHLGTNMEQAFS